MEKRYNSNWNAKKLFINFNHKQWRQDFAAYVREKLFWDRAKVTRARSISQKNSFYEKGLKQFEVYDGYGRSVNLTFKNESDIVDSSDSKLIEDYFKLRGM